MLVESIGDAEDEAGEAEGRAAHQGPDVDGTTRLVGVTEERVGQIVTAVVIDTDGVDLIAEVRTAA